MSAGLISTHRRSGWSPRRPKWPRCIKSRARSSSTPPTAPGLLSKVLPRINLKLRWCYFLLDDCILKRNGFLWALRIGEGWKSCINQRGRSHQLIMWRARAVHVTQNVTLPSVIESADLRSGHISFSLVLINSDGDYRVWKTFWSISN